MNLTGKTINFIGDSITEGCGVEDIANCRFDNVIKKQCNLKAVYNYGISATRIAHQRVASEMPRADLNFCARAYDLNPDSDITVVFGGTNDYGHGDAPFGTLEDKTPDTFCGAVEFLMNTLKELYPEMTVIFMTPAHRINDDKPSVNPKKNNNAYPLKNYVDVIKTKGEQKGIPVLDLFENLGLDPNDEKIMEKYAPDGLHFNDLGHKVIAERLISFIQDL
ncbi:MAG: SGNH/GDSL hydrolase family protein [Acutalibacteraceae bacterium]|nr:SGNH/GDSL hydrolase family protein [Acutalibacteraceae bacterium]